MSGLDLIQKKDRKTGFELYIPLLLVEQALGQLGLSSARV
jgi:hypothetical protein